MRKKYHLGIILTHSAEFIYAAIIGSDNGLTPARRQAFIDNNAHY